MKVISISSRPQSEGNFPMFESMMSRTFSDNATTSLAVSSLFMKPSPRLLTATRSPES